MDKTLSDSDISPYVKNIVLYNELKDMTPDDVLKNIPMAILYQETPNCGHWTLLHKTPEGIEFFDPYGIIVDGEFKDLSWQQPHYLARLLYDLSKRVRINYSPYKLQKRKAGVNTCGRWTILRSLFSDWTIDEFAKVVMAVSKVMGIIPDQLSVMAFKN